MTSAQPSSAPGSSPEQFDAFRKSIWICYADGGAALEVRAIYAWDRADLPVPVIGSSGPKDYLKNDVWKLFNANPDVDRIVMVRAAGPPFFLMRIGACWFDVTGKQVVSNRSLHPGAAA